MLVVSYPSSTTQKQILSFNRLLTHVIEWHVAQGLLSKDKLMYANLAEGDRSSMLIRAIINSIQVLALSH